MSAGGATNISVGVTSRSTPSSASIASPSYARRASVAASASASVTARQRSIFVRRLSPYSSPCSS